MNKIKGFRLAFGCQARVGKSIVTEYLKSKYGGIELAFADPLYDILRYVQNRCGLRSDKDRRFLQLIGTEWGREKDKNLWINLLLKEIKSTRKNTNIYISDTRFINEFRALKEVGFITIKITRNSASNDNSFGNGSRSHLSETELLSIPNEEWDYMISNDSTLENLYSELERIIESNFNVIK